MLATDKWALAYHRIVVRSDDGSMIGVYEPTRPGLPVELRAAARRRRARRRRRRDAVVLAAARAADRGSSPMPRASSAAATSRRASQLVRDDELGDLGKAFDDMADRTSALISSQRQLMADVSHELRTPLARIRVALELAAEDPVAAKDVLADVGCDLDEIDQLIADILTTARLESEPAITPHADRRSVSSPSARCKRFTARHPGRTLERTIDGRGPRGRLRPGAAAPRARQPARQRGEVLRCAGHARGHPERHSPSRSRSSTRASACRPKTSHAPARRSGAPTAAALARPAASASAWRSRGGSPARTAAT